MSAIVGPLMENILYVQDMNAQVRFYRDTLGLSIRYPAGLEDYANEFWVELETGPCTLVLHGGGQRRLGADSPKFVFYADDISAARTTLVGRGVALGEIRSPAPGVLVCDGVDPEGNHFSLEHRD
jgi:catechol 2,3-dioxygenase-like lactoylglutathione lyase family enzyme